MDTGATPDLISQLLAQTFSELGATGSVARTLLLRDRQFIGQRFRCGGFQAVSLVGKEEIEFYDQTCVLLKTVRLEGTDKKSAA